MLEQRRTQQPIPSWERNKRQSNRVHQTFFCVQTRSFFTCQTDRLLLYSLRLINENSIIHPTNNNKIDQCYFTSLISNDAPATLTASASPLNDNSPPIPSASHFSYFIRPSTPCVLGREDYDEDIDEDIFFLTAGGIVHSCPNIYELTTNNHRKLQSCDHLISIDRHTSTLDPHYHCQELNAYDTELDRYSVLPRFQPLLASSFSSLAQSNDSFNSELELYKELVA